MTIRVEPHGLRAFTIFEMERMAEADILAPDERIELIARDLGHSQSFVGWNPL